MDGGAVTIHFNGDTTNIDNAMEKTKNNISSKLDELGAKFVGVGAIMSAALTAPILAFGKAGIEYNAQMEQYTTALNTLTGSAEETDKIMQQIKKDAVATPFDVSGLTQANQLLLSAGLNADESRETILALGDAVASTGGGNSELQRMAYNLQQVKNTGKATAMDIRQFAMAGIPIYQLLADYTGKTTEEIQDMTISYEDLSGALKFASKEGGRFYGAMENQSKTTAGAFSNFKESFQVMAGTLTQTLMPILVKLMNKITEIMNKFSQLSPRTQKIILTIGGIVAAAGPLLIVLGGIMKGVTTIIPLITTIGSVLSGPVIIIGLIIAALVLLYTKCEWFRDLVNSIIENLKPLLQSLWDLLKPIFDSLIAAIQQIWVVLEPILKVILTSVANTINFIITIITDVIKVITWLINKFNEAKSKVSNATSGIRNAVVGGFNKMIDKVKNIGKNIIDGLIGGITGGAQKLYNKCKEVGKKALNKIKETLGIHSPSTEFAMVGKFSMLGFEKGLMDMQPEIDKAINSMFTLNPSLTGTMNNSMSPNINVVNNVNLETDPLGQVVNKIKTYSGGAKNDYNWGTGL